MAQYYRVGSGVTDTPTDIKAMAGQASATSHYVTLESVSGTDYQVTSGKTLRLTKLIYHSSTASCIFRVGYGDTGVSDGTSAPTNSVIVSQNFSTATAYQQYEVDVCIAVPAGKYPFVLSNSGDLRVQAYGLEA